MTHYELKTENYDDPEEVGEPIADVEAASPDAPLEGITPRDPNNEHHVSAAASIRDYAAQNPDLPAALAVRGWGYLSEAA